MQGRKVQGIMGIGNYQARTQDITDSTVCRNPKIACHYHIVKINMNFGSEFIKPMRSMEVTADVELSATLVCTEP